METSGLYEVIAIMDGRVLQQEFDFLKDAKWFLSRLKKDKDVSRIRIVDRLTRLRGGNYRIVVEWER